MKLGASLESVVESQDVSSVILLHQEFDLKDMSRRILQRTHRENFAPACRDLLGTDEVMMTCHKSKSLKN